MNPYATGSVPASQDLCLYPLPRKSRKTGTKAWLPLAISRSQSQKPEVKVSFRSPVDDAADRVRGGRRRVKGCCWRYPALLLDLGMLDTFSGQGLEGPEQVVAHKVKSAGRQVLARMGIGQILLRRMDSQFRRRKRKNQPALSDINMGERESITKKRPVSLRITAGEKQMHTVNHAGHSRTSRAEICLEKRADFHI